MLPDRKSSPIRSALIIAHPGHELRVFGWYEQARPTTFVLTSVSRNGDNGRTSLSRDLACQTRSSIGSLFGRYLDRQIYEAILKHEVSLFADWASELTDALVDLGPELVVADGWQFYNVAHDLAHLMARLAVERAGRQLGRNIELVEFDVAPRSLGEMPPQGPEAFRLDERLTGVTEMEGRFGGVDERLAKLQAVCDERLAAMEKRLATADERHATLTQRLVNSEALLASVEDRFRRNEPLIRLIRPLAKYARKLPWRGS